VGKGELHEKRSWLSKTIETYRASRQSTLDRLGLARNDCDNAALTMRTVEEDWRRARIRRDELIASLAYVDGTIADLEAEIRVIENYLTRIAIEESAERKEAVFP